MLASSCGSLHPHTEVRHGAVAHAGIASSTCHAQHMYMCTDGVVGKPINRPFGNNVITNSAFSVWTSRDWLPPGQSVVTVYQASAPAACWAACLSNNMRLHLSIACKQSVALHAISACREDLGPLRWLLHCGRSWWQGGD